MSQTAQEEIILSYCRLHKSMPSLLLARHIVEKENWLDRFDLHAIKRIQMIILEYRNAFMKLYQKAYGEEYRKIYKKGKGI